MRRLSLYLVFALGLGVLASAQTTVFDPTPYVHQTMETTLFDGSGYCSGTAIAPLALLTASHCESPTSIIRVDGVKAKIVSTIRDEYDHTIFLLQMEKPFEHFAPVNWNAMPKLGDPAVFLGNPGPLNNFYRSGMFSGGHKDTDGDTGISWMFSFLIAPGDSGGGIFDNNGVLYAVVSYMIDAGDHESGKHLWVTMAFPFRFTEDQLARAKAFTYPPLQP